MTSQPFPSLGQLAIAGHADGGTIAQRGDGFQCHIAAALWF